MDGEAKAGMERALGSKPAYPLFQDGQDARAYFVGRIRKRAEDEGLQFTEFETEYLRRTEQGDNDAAASMLDAIKGKRFEEFDSRISGLAWRAYQQDLETIPEAKERYEEASRVLANVEGESLNLGMFVNCIALERSPEELNKTSPILSILILGFILLALLAGLFRHC